ncbi:uncharacterized protein LOC132605334 [Lycium barbarum]|uniref:uncharacterized protein LOC132605334 n=1 Tax=Lycium barbarum TaxID=112863 RepID=UPI00293EB795|nr:uncharacterized protein LOC132605334 [Lycium barbarum]
MAKLSFLHLCLLAFLLSGVLVDAQAKKRKRCSAILHRNQCDAQSCLDECNKIHGKDSFTGVCAGLEPQSCVCVYYCGPPVY